MAEESGFPAVDGAAVDALAESYQRRGGQPGIAYGVVAGGRLVHAGGFGGLCAGEATSGKVGASARGRCVWRGRRGRRRRVCAGRQDGLPYRVDDEELHRVGGAGPA